MERTVRIEGYWNVCDQNSHLYEKYTELGYVLPVPNVLTKKEAHIIYQLILEKQKYATTESYRGFSHSRITGEVLGSKEYVDRDGGWSWPGDFAEHYVYTHRVKPTDDFLKYIGYLK